MYDGFTWDDLKALDAAIKTNGGVKRVKYHDRDVEYHSLDEMIRARKEMYQFLIDESGGENKTESGKKSRYLRIPAEFSKG